MIAYPIEGCDWGDYVERNGRRVFVAEMGQWARGGCPAAACGLVLRFVSRDSIEGPGTIQFTLGRLTIRLVHFDPHPNRPSAKVLLEPVQKLSTDVACQ